MVSSSRASLLYPNSRAASWLATTKRNDVASMAHIGAGLLLGIEHLFCETGCFTGPEVFRNLSLSTSGGITVTAINAGTANQHHQCGPPVRGLMWCESLDRCDE